MEIFRHHLVVLVLSASSLERVRVFFPMAIHIWTYFIFHTLQLLQRHASYECHKKRPINSPSKDIQLLVQREIFVFWNHWLWSLHTHEYTYIHIHTHTHVTRCSTVQWLSCSTHTRNSRLNSWMVWISLWLYPAPEVMLWHHQTARSLGMKTQDLQTQDMNF